MADSRAAEDAGSFHETQSLMQCAAHSLNNLLQAPAFTSAALDEIATGLGGSLSLAHRWPFLGNHDANVVTLALHARGLDAEWWDARRADAELSALREGPDAERTLGVLLNVRSTFLRVLPGRHWLALRKLPHAPSEPVRWAEHDSKLAEPVTHAGAPAVLARLQRALREQDGHLIVVRGGGAAG